MTARVGILVGGAASRMGGRAKGLLDAGEGEPIVVRLARVARAAGASDVVLVGDTVAYDGLGLARIRDAAGGAGPLAGVVALLESAAGADVVALACDLPRVVPSVIARLIAASPGKTLAPRRDGFWETLCARYAGSALREAHRRLREGELSLHALLRAIDVEELTLTEGERATLLDWDSPEDIPS
jgi:molybdopterin-guanine dinucleotide biosynthesis protein A